MPETSPVIVPRMNVNDDQAVIAAWHIPVGERVAAGQVIATLETTKVTFDVSAEREGYVGYELEVKSVVAVGDVFAWISDAPGGRPSVRKSESSVSVQSGITRKALRRMRELGVTEAELRGLERVEVADVERIATLRAGHTPNDFSVPLEQAPSKVAEAAHLAESYRAVVPSMVTVPVSCKRVQATVEGLSSKIGPLSLLELIIHEAAAVLPEFPDLNGFFRGGQAWTYREISIGFAVNAGRSLRVPVIHKADHLSQLDVCRLARELLLRYFRNELSMPDVTGGTFTVTDLSAQGVTHFVPVLNDRQSAILGICAEQPEHPYQNLVLAFDHRMSDGMRAGTFLGSLRERLES